MLVSVVETETFLACARRLMGEAEREAIVKGYAGKAGFSLKQVNR